MGSFSMSKRASASWWRIIVGDFVEGVGEKGFVKSFGVCIIKDRDEGVFGQTLGWFDPTPFKDGRPNIGPVDEGIAHESFRTWANDDEWTVVTRVKGGGFSAR